LDWTERMPEIRAADLGPLDCCAWVDTNAATTSTAAQSHRERVIMVFMDLMVGT
jgi:hypothetical protein